MKKIYSLGIVIILAISIWLSLSINTAAIASSEYTSITATVRGGAITDGKDLKDIRWAKHQGYERIVLDIYEGAYDRKGPAAEVPGSYEITYEYYPYRFSIVLNGIRAVTANFNDLKKSDLIKDSYRTPYLDDSGMEFAIELHKPVEYKIYELHRPARIVIDIREQLAPPNRPVIYSLRTNAGLGVEEAGYLREQLGDLGSKRTRIIKDNDKGFFIEEGYYTDKKEAEARRVLIEEQLKETTFLIEAREATPVTPIPDNSVRTSQSLLQRIIQFIKTIVG